MGGYRKAGARAWQGGAARRGHPRCGKARRAENPSKRWEDQVKDSEHAAPVVRFVLVIGRLLNVSPPLPPPRLTSREPTPTHPPVASLSLKMEGLTSSDEGALKALGAVAAVCLGGLLVQPLFAPPDIASVASKPTPTVQTKKAEPAPAPAPKPQPAPAPAPKVEPAPGKRRKAYYVAGRVLWSLVEMYVVVGVAGCRQYTRFVVANH